MSRENKHTNYSAEDIAQYLAGKLSSREMHAMEKAALDDAFLAEAMEGYEAMKDTAWKNELTALHEQMAHKSTVAKVIQLHQSKNNWWKAAAAVFILGAGAILTFILSKEKAAEKNNPQIAQTITADTGSTSPKENKTPASVTASLNPTATDTKEGIQATNGLVTEKGTKIKPADQYITDQDTPQLKASDQKNTSGIAEHDKGIAAAPPLAGNSAPVLNNNDQLAYVTVNTNNEAAANQNNEAEGLMRQKNQANANYKKVAALNNFFTAQIVAPDNTPLPFTNISIKKENFGTYADAKGMVRLVSTDSILNIEVRSVGYLPKTFSLHNKQQQTKIILQEDDAAQNEKPVTGNNKVGINQKPRRATLLTDSAVNVEPVDGWDNYNTYVANNLDIPEEMLNRDFHGEVELSFDVRSNGTITNLHINKSLGAGYDDAAKRLILEGPQWKVKKGRKTSAKIKVQF